MNIRVWGTSLLMFLSTVTAVGQTANRYLKAPLPQDWEESGEVFQQILPVDDHWWKSFQDTKLDSLIALAVDRNYSVAMAINRIAAARANLWIERSNFFPSIGLNAGWTRQETSGNTSSLPQTTDHYYDASLSMSWELDIFGSIRKRVKAQKENFAASKEEYTGVMVSLAAEVASAYINLRELQQELEVVKKNSASQEEVLKSRKYAITPGWLLNSMWHRPSLYYIAQKPPFPSWKRVSISISQHWLSYWECIPRTFVLFLNLVVHCPIIWNLSEWECLSIYYCDGLMYEVRN